MLEKLQNQKWIAAVSGGPDSMALLDMAQKAGIILIAAHVNYHHRPTAGRDQALTEAYCSEHHIPIRILHAEEPSGNFQDWARRLRYDFFCSLKDEEKASGVLIAHQQDDLLETYLLQKQRGGIPDYWGLKESGWWKNCQLLRPLLSFSKKALEEYCLDHGVPYGIDESNLTDDYARNRIRHHQLEKMGAAEKKALLLTIKRENAELMCSRQKAAELFKPVMTAEEILNASEAEFFLGEWIFFKTGLRLGMPFLRQLLQQLKSSRNFEVPLNNCVKLSKMYNRVEIIAAAEVSYCYVLDTLEMVKTEWFTICSQGKSTEAVTLYADDFPIIIRNARKNDRILLRFGTKRLSRWFIDRKIPQHSRKSWPVVVNRHQEVILVPQIGCDVKHYSNNPTCFVVK